MSRNYNNPATGLIVCCCGAGAGSPVGGLGNVTCVQSQANYQAFPPGLLLDYDVVEIRRTWHFDMAVRLY